MCEEDSWIESIQVYPPARIRAGVDAVTEAVRSLGLDNGTIGAELGGVLWMRMPFEDLGLLQENLPGARFVDASTVLWDLRARKSPAEMEYIRRAVAITDGAFETFFGRLRPGMTESEAHRMLAAEHLSRGAESPGSITLSAHTPGVVRSCDRGLRRHSDRVLTDGEVIAHDAGGVYRGYWSDYCRTFALRSATQHHRDAYRVVYACMQAAIETVRPGVPIADLVKASNGVMAAAGHAEHAGKVTSIGHAMGLDIIEPPFIALEDDTILDEGMVLTVEPSLYAHDAYIMLEEDVLVTQDGYEVLSRPASPELPVL
jgi:Xaa-Pro aminopeptidase